MTSAYRGCGGLWDFGDSRTGEGVVSEIRSKIAQKLGEMTQY